MNCYERTRRRQAREAARAQQPRRSVPAGTDRPTAELAPPVARSAMHAPWPPGTSGNPAGHSKARRADDALVRSISSRNADGSVAEVIRAGISSDTIARVVLARVLAGDFRFFKLMLEWTDDKYSPEEEGAAAIVPADPDPRIDPVVIRRLERLLASLDVAEVETMIPTSDAGAPPAVIVGPAAGRAPPGAPPPAHVRAKPPDMSRADWLRLRRGRK
jgi:hypothetical protein